MAQVLLLVSGTEVGLCSQKQICYEGSTSEQDVLQHCGAAPQLSH